MQHNINILVPDGNSTWAMSVISCLSSVDSYKLFVLSSKKRTAAKYSRHISYYKYYESTSDDCWIEIINAEIQSNQISIVVPIAEEAIRFFIKNSKLITGMTRIIPLPSIQDFDIAANKFELNKILKANNIPHPNSIFINDIGEVEQLNKIKFPVLVKPFANKGGDGITRFETRNDCEVYIKKNQKVFLQEFIDGYDIDCSVLCLDGEILCHTIQKGNLPGHTAFAPHLGFDFLKNDEVLDAVKQIMAVLNWSGVAHVDLRYDENSNNFKILEINARFWGSVESSKIAGINFPDLAVKLARGEKFEIQNYANNNVLRFKGFLKLVKRRPLTVFRLSFIKRNTEVPSILKDPLPTIYRFFELIRRTMN